MFGTLEQHMNSGRLSISETVLFKESRNKVPRHSRKISEFILNNWHVIKYGKTTADMDIATDQKGLG